MSVTAGEIGRAVIFEDREHDRRRDEGNLDRLGEIEQQIQIRVEGNAGQFIDWTISIPITFDVVFIDATGQRYSNLVEPAFTYGTKIDVSSDRQVIVIPVVQSYTASDDGSSIVGAAISIGCLSGTDVGYDFTGYVNLVWQGFGSAPNESSDPDFTP